VPVADRDPDRARLLAYRACEIASGQVLEPVRRMDRQLYLRDAQTRNAGVANTSGVVALSVSRVWQGGEEREEVIIDGCAARLGCAEIPASGRWRLEDPRGR